MSTLLSGKLAAPEASIWRPSEGKYLARLRLTTLRNYLRALFVEQGDPVSLEQGVTVLQRVWRDARLERQPGRSHAYRHLLALQLLGLVAPHGRREGYALSPRGSALLRLGEPGDTLSDDERRHFADAMFSPPTSMESPLLAFAHLFAPDYHTLHGFRSFGQQVTLRQIGAVRLDIVTSEGIESIADKDAIEHVLHGCRDLFRQADLIGDIPLADNNTSRAHRLLFPVRALPDTELEAAVEDVLAYIRNRVRTSVRLPITTLGIELRPRLKLTLPDYQRILHLISRRCAGELYFDRLSSIQIAGREDAYVRIGDYWRASIVRF